PPASVMEATKAYREESDPVSDFVADRWILHPDAQISVAELWDEYVEWRLRTGEQRPLTRPEFTRRLERLGCRKKKCGHNRDWTWLGICRKLDAEAQHLPLAADVRTDADVNLQ